MNRVRGPELDSNGLGWGRVRILVDRYTLSGFQSGWKIYKVEIIIQINDFMLFIMSYS
jgi:hypothetical protein